MLINVADIGDLDSSAGGRKSAETTQGFVRGTCHFSLDIHAVDSFAYNVYSYIYNGENYCRLLVSITTCFNLPVANFAGVKYLISSIFLFVHAHGQLVYFFVFNHFLIFST